MASKAAFPKVLPPKPALQNDLDDKVIAEEYKIWKKNTPFLYDLVMTHALEWPSLTVQWLPEASPVEGQPGAVMHKLLLGTHTSNGEQNHLMVCSVSLPKKDEQSDEPDSNEDPPNMDGNFGGVNGKVEMKQKLNHDGEVNRARYMPQNPFIVATKSPEKEVFVFDLSKHPLLPEGGDGPSRPEHRCTGHEEEGYGLSWSPHQEGRLISGSDDMRICLWDIERGGAKIEAARTWRGHSDVIEDVAWHMTNPDLFGSVGDDAKLLIWDARENASDKPASAVENAHSTDINCLAFNPFTEFLVLTGSADRTVKLWDMRNMKQSLSTFDGHKGDVLQVQWAPFNEAIFASCSADRRCVVWDLSKIGAEQSAEDAEDGPPELLFIHGGHTSKISDFSWNANDEWTLASVSEDNILQMWQMAENIYDESDDADNENEAEELETAA